MSELTILGNDPLIGERDRKRKGGERLLRTCRSKCSGVLHAVQERWWLREREPRTGVARSSDRRDGRIAGMCNARRSGERHAEELGEIAVHRALEGTVAQRDGRGRSTGRGGHEKSKD